ncbi:Retrotrans-gag domain-containing protein [Mycena sanguinolenta]|uniref:Retrotrans-gag domain-containing protein n=1 Tax=Mycena sanguinolenta TaxID=230812 RepID=A0A8H7D4D1_9AGAR|nr:Retrotrans-gag domain-containing protein [Mycena sanguinolenta]
MSHDHRSTTPGWGSDAWGNTSSGYSSGFDNGSSQPSGDQQYQQQFQQPPTPSPDAVIHQLFTEVRSEAAATRQFYEAQQNAVLQTLSNMTNVLNTMLNTLNHGFAAAAANAPPPAPAAGPPPAATAPLVVPTPTTAAPAPVPVAPRPLKGREPRLFTGSTKDVEAFIDEVETNIRLQRMTDDLDKTGYFSTYLKDGNPKSWYYSVKATDMSLLSDYPRFVASFRSQFSDSNYAATALRQIKALRQTGSCANYAARFLPRWPQIKRPG